MPMYDRACPDGHQMIDCWEPITAPEVACKECGAATQRVWLSGTAAVIGDDIPGGLWIRHGLCNEDGTPRKYYSKSEIQKEAERRGLVNRVEHTVDPRTGGDKSRHTTRWY
jgi:hypothetical protein